MAAKKDLNEKENVEQAPKKKRGGVLFFLMIMAVAIIAAGLVMGAVIYFMGVPGLVPKVKASAPPVMETMELGERVVNLADPAAVRYLRVRTVIEFKKNEKLAAEIKEKNAQVMEGMLHILRSKTVEDIRPLNKEEKVKAEILNDINSKLKNGKIEKVYFTDFLIQ